VSAPRPVGTEFPVLDIVVDDVPVGDEQVVAGSANRFEGAPRPRMAAWWAARWVPLVRAAAWAASVSAVFNHTDSCRVRAGLGLPPEALLPGQIPAQDARCAGLGKTLMSAPISASRLIAVFRATPGMVTTRCNIGS
jgi:hypothetical protein